MTTAIRAGGREESHEEKASRLFQAALANKEGKSPKDWFMAMIRKGGWDRQLAGVFGSGKREEYLDAASTFFESQLAAMHQPTAGMQPKEMREVNGVALTPEAITARMRGCSKSLAIPPNGVRVWRFKDPAGRRDASAITVETGMQATAGDLENIQKAVVSYDFVPGVSFELPNAMPHILAGQSLLPKRSIIILPAGSSDMESAPYGYTAKGVRFSQGVQADFDLLEIRRVLLGEKIPRAVQMSLGFSEDGRSQMHPVSPDLSGGMGFLKAEHEYFMRLLAVNQRGLGDMVDPPVLYGVFDRIKSAKGEPQGFVVVKVSDFGRRGDDEINSSNDTYLGILLGRNPEEKAEIIGQQISNIQSTLMHLATGAPIEGVRHQDSAKILLALSGMINQLERYKSVSNPDELAVFAGSTAFLSTLGVRQADFKGLLDKASPEIISHFRHDVEAIPKAVGTAARLLVEHGIGHDQMHIGNSRFRRTGERQRSVVVCDWHETHDLLSMTHAQAVGYIAKCVRTLADSTSRVDDTPLMRKLGTEAMAVALNAFFRPETREESEMVNDVMRQALTRDPRTLLNRMAEFDPNVDPSSPSIKVGARSLLDVAIHESEFKPITEVDNPLIRLIMKIYPKEKHEQLKTRFG